MSLLTIDIPTPRWAVPLLAPKRFKGAKGGRSGGKSHFFAEAVVEALIYNKDFQVVCIREVQKSIKFSVKKLIVSKIKALKVAHLFDVQLTEIRRRGGEGLIIFQGMQDHTADSIKSLEGFDVAWIEEANKLSAKSLELLLPTIRKAGSEIWASWNPDQPSDPIDKLFREELEPDTFTLVHVNYYDNPFNSAEVYAEAERNRKNNPDTFDHVWMGAYNKIAHSQVMRGKWREAQFERQTEWGPPLLGADWGFADDPTVLVECYVHNRRLMVFKESYRQQLELDDIATTWRQEVPVLSRGRYVVRADNSRPETISHVRKHDINVIPCEKWPGSVADGIEHLRSYDEIVIHSQCVKTLEEARLYRYKVDKRSGDILPEIVDKDNHCWDAIRYALGPLIKPPKLEIYE